MIRGSDVAGNMRVFQIRLESSNLSLRTNNIAEFQIPRVPGSPEFA